MAIVRRWVAGRGDKSSRNPEMVNVGMTILGQAYTDDDPNQGRYKETLPAVDGFMADGCAHIRALPPAD